MWFKVDDSFHSHPKALEASLAALGLWALAGSWSGKHRKDGFVSDQAVNQLSRGAGELAGELVAAGLWKRAKGGYRFHQWGERNPTSAEAERIAGQKASGGAMGNHLRWHVKGGKRANGCPFCQEIDESLSVAPPIAPPIAPLGADVDGGSQKANREGGDQEQQSGRHEEERASDDRSDKGSDTDRISDRTPNPDPTRPEGSTTYSNTGGFAEVWTALPHRKGDSKHKTELAYNAAVKRGVAHDVILAHAAAYATERRGKDPQFTKGGEAWFNLRPWDNGEPEPPAYRSLWDN